ncbi:hypothetical protein LZ30DRAFT_176017 [Colletotrichum cereale]|nr:hypothetical protein LZ30DRAFT_176017 [Colletotrichum cereale]
MKAVIEINPSCQKETPRGIHHQSIRYSACIGYASLAPPLVPICSTVPRTRGCRPARTWQRDDKQRRSDSWLIEGPEPPPLGAQREAGRRFEPGVHHHGNGPPSTEKRCDAVGSEPASQPLGAFCDAFTRQLRSAKAKVCCRCQSGLRISLNESGGPWGYLRNVLRVQQGALRPALPTHSDAIPDREMAVFDELLLIRRPQLEC